MIAAPMRSAGRSVPSREARLSVMWGIAEATVFFVIPDVFVSYVAVRRGWRPGLVLAVLATLGAMVGGVITYMWGALDPESAIAVFAHLPAIDTAMIDRVWAEVAEHDVLATLGGPLQGQPYKLYAAAAGDLGSNPAAFIAMTFPARIVRFAAAALIAGWLRERTAGWMGPRPAVALWAGFWVVLYLFFWS